MKRPFFSNGLALEDLTKFVTPEVCENTANPALTTSEWAKTMLNFNPSAKQPPLRLKTAGLQILRTSCFAEAAFARDA